MAEYLNIPPLQTTTIRTPTIVAMLNQSFEFETATIEAERHLLGLRREWVIRKRRATAWGYTEVLSREAEVEEAVGLDMVALPGGTFTMGAPESETGSTDDERPQHEVTLQPFYMSRYPVTQAQWRTIAAMESTNLNVALALLNSAVGSVRGEGLKQVERLIIEGAWNGQRYSSIKTQSTLAGFGYTESHIRNSASQLWGILSEVLDTQVKKSDLREVVTRWINQRELSPNLSSFKGDNLPVENVTWEDAQEFCRQLSVLTGKDYRLPTEAEWEYACRASTTTPFHFGETITADLANYRASKAFGGGPTGEYREQTTVVGQFPANSFGLCDMHGNVWEWCQDHWHESYEGAPTDGSAWLSSDANENRRVLRGGSWYDLPEVCRSALRFWGAPDYSNDVVGFRVVCGLAR